MGTQALFLLFWCVVGGTAANNGVMLMYRPRDISKECFASQNLNFDLTFGMGMSDTITLVFRTQFLTDYDCTIDIVTEPGIYLMAVLMYPNMIRENCRSNREAFTLVEGNNCVFFCDLMEPYEMRSEYYKDLSIDQMRFRFKSNSSVNQNMNTNLYQITFTSARLITDRNCNAKNECVCSMRSHKFCFTSGVVCDGIKNCGVVDWYDERKSDCQLPTEKMNCNAMIAVAAVLFLAFIGGTHLILRCLPPLANSFFIFNANEDNRLYVDPLLQPPAKEQGFLKTQARRKSVIPVYLSSSDEDSLADTKDESVAIADELVCLNLAGNTQMHAEPATTEETSSRRTTRMKSMTARLQDKFRAVAGLASLSRPHHVNDMNLQRPDV